MDKRKIIFIITFLVLISLVAIWIIIYNNKKYNPSDIIQSKMNLKLPTSTKTIHFDYNFIESSFDAKVQICTQDIESIKKILKECFGEEYDFKKNRIVYNWDYIKWWDMDLNDIEACYNFSVTGKNHKMIENWAFNVKQKDGNYYLFLSHF